MSMKCRLLFLIVFIIFCCAITISADDISDIKADIKYLKDQIDFQKAMTDELLSAQTDAGDKSTFKMAGFIEFRYENMDIKNGEYTTATPNGSAVAYKLWKSQLPGQFSVRNLNLYFDYSYGPKVRALLEVKLLPNPTGDDEFLLDAQTVTNDGNGSFISFGSTYIERAYLDYKISDFFKIQFGKFLTPFGIWNVEHGAPILPSIRVPATISYGFFPNNQMGINFHGNKLLGSWEFDYNLYVSNGRAV